MSRIDEHKAAYEAFAGGDFEAALENVADNAVFHQIGTGLPHAGDHKGKEAIMKTWLPALGETSQDLKLDPAKFIEDGDWMTVFGHETSTVNGMSLSSDFAHVWRWEEGEIAEAWFFADSAAGVRALG